MYEAPVYKVSTQDFEETLNNVSCESEIIGFTHSLIDIKNENGHTARPVFQIVGAHKLSGRLEARRSPSHWPLSRI